MNADKLSVLQLAKTIRQPFHEVLAAIREGLIKPDSFEGKHPRFLASRASEIGKLLRGEPTGHSAVTAPAPAAQTSTSSSQACDNLKAQEQAAIAHFVAFVQQQRFNQAASALLDKLAAEDAERAKAEAELARANAEKAKADKFESLKAAGKYEEAFQLLPAKERAEFFGPANYAAFMSARRCGALQYYDRR